MILQAEVMLFWLRQSWQVRKSNKKFGNIRVISHNLIFPQFCWAIESYLLYQINQTTSKSGYYFTNYITFTSSWWFEKLQTWSNAVQETICWQ